MVSVRIYEIAKENNVSSKELLELCQKLGIDVKSHSSAVSDEQVIQIKNALKENKSKKTKKK